MNGKLAWDEQIESTVFVPNTRLSTSNSIYVKNLESLDESKSLELLKLHLNGQQQVENEMSAYDDDDDDGMLLSTTNKFGSSYMAMSSADTVYGGQLRGQLDKGALEIGTNSLVLDLINNSDESHLLSAAADMISTTQAAHNRDDDQGSWSNTIQRSKETPQLQRQRRRQQRLLDFNEAQQSITLALENQLNLSPITANSITVNELITGSDITGSLEENLE